MKQLFCTLIGIFALVVTNALPSNAQQAFYIYRNDGAINTFITTEIDSMAYSCFDLDSVSHDEYVVHEVYTPDSIYRIPLALIDSIGFVTPETVYQPGVRVLEGEMRNYIISRDDLTLTFQSDTPTNLLPKIGDKIVTTEIDDVITNVFVGQVSEINTKDDGIEVVCSPVLLTDVFESYYGIIKKSDEPIRARGLSDGFYSTNGTLTYSPGTISYNLFNAQIQYEAIDNLLTVYPDAKATVSLTPTIDYNAYIIVNKNYGLNISVTAIGNYTVEELFSLSGNIQFGGDIKIHEIVIPIPEAFIDIFVEFGISGTATATVSADQTWTQKYRHIFHWDWSSKEKNILKNTNELKPISSTHTSDVALSGNLSIGLYAKTGIAFFATSSFDISEIGFRIDGGMCLEGTYVPYKDDIDTNLAKFFSTSYYNKMKDCTYPLSWFYGLSAYAKLFKWSVSTTPQFPFIPTSKQGLIRETRAVPLFSNINMERNENGIYHASANVSGIVEPTDIGFALIPYYDLGYPKYSYPVYYDGPEGKVSENYNTVPQFTYTLYPMVKYKGIDIIAEPYIKIEASLCPDENHPHMIDLGLPSGTQWACCNIGTSHPTYYGFQNGYAWGETEEKENYSLSNYTLAQPATETDGAEIEDGVIYSYIYIGDNICGTKYDVATVKWGDAWRMPSVEEMEELVSQCTWQIDEYSYHSYIGTGPNGTSIYLPDVRSGSSGYWTGCLDHASSFRWGSIYSPHPYALWAAWNDSAPHVHPHTYSGSGPDNNSYLVVPYDQYYVRAVSASNIESSQDETKTYEKPIRISE